MEISQVLTTRSIPVLDLSALLDQLAPDTEIKLGGLTLTIEALRQGFAPSGPVKQHRLTAEQRVAIKKEPKGISLQKLALKYGTSVQTIKKHRAGG